MRFPLSIDEACVLPLRTLACAVVNTRLDYCNGLLYGVSAKYVQRQPHIQNSVMSCAMYCMVDLSQIHFKLFSGYRSQKG